MITIESGRLTIPEEERFIGFAGDNDAVEKQIAVIHRSVPGCTYTLCLRFDDGSIRSVPLSATVYGSDTLLRWRVEREDLLASGVVAAQVKMTDAEDNTEHTTKDYFWVGSSVELDDDGAEIEHITPSQLENRVREAVNEIESKASYRADDGFWYVFDRSRGGFIKTGYRDDLQVDSAMSSSSLNPVSNSTVTVFIGEQISQLREEIGDIEAALAQI